LRVKKLIDPALAAAELSRRRAEERWRYYKIPWFLTPLAASDAHTKLLSCPNKIGKSTFAFMDNYWTAMDCHPMRTELECKKFKTPNISWLLGPTLNHVDEVFVQGMREWGIDKFWKSYNIKRGKIEWRNGSLTYCKSYDDRKNIQGRGVRKITIDEECPADIWNELLWRFKAGERLDISVTATPIECEEWFAELCDLAEKGTPGIFLAPEISIYDASVSKGGHLTDEDIQRVETLCLDEQERAVRMFGRRVRRAGRVLELDEIHRFSVHELPNGVIPQDWIRIIGIDPHARKPHSVVWIALHPQNLDAYVYDHALLGGNVGQIVQTLKERNKDQNIFCAYLDPKGTEGLTSNLQEVNWNYYDDLCNQYPEIPFEKSVRDPKMLIDAVRHRLMYDKTDPASRPHLFIESALEDLWGRLKTLRWKEYRNREQIGLNEGIVTGKDDDLKAIGYALIKHPRYIAPGVEIEESRAIRRQEREPMIHAEMGY
jgi:hypothetical protein